MDENSDRFPLPKGPWARNLDRFPKNFKEESILHTKTRQNIIFWVTECSRNTLGTLFFFISSCNVKCKPHILFL
ncbi:hypothetical protein JTB14_018573 [Gonioctena quinquepunctata]|nr:hypothetical protein JTB14_018573 [Gonioctena quinquepunctata]